MPWMLEGNCVYKKVGDQKGELVKCHDTHEKAVAHMRALYANVHEGLAEFSMAIVKTSIKDGEMRWRSVNSDTGEDYFTEKMSVELFRDMIERIEKNIPVPEQFKRYVCEDGWCGGMPYVSVAHFKSRGGKNVPGEVKSLYIDGDKLKSTGVLYQNKLGVSVYRSLKKDEETLREDKTRISIGFIDLEHSHGDRYTFTRRSVTDKCPLCAEGIGDKIYKKGILVHLALTRIPANPRTDMEVEKSMSTKLEDAKSIIEDEEVLGEMELRSTAEEEPELIIVKSNDSDADEKGDCPEGDEECEKKMKDKKGMDKMHDEMKSTAEPTPTPVAVPELTPLQKSIADFETKVTTLKSQGLMGEDALKELQSSFDEIGNVVRAEFTPQPKPEEVAAQNLESTLRSMFDAFEQKMTQTLSQTVAPIQAEMQELRALSLAGKPPAAPRREEAPKPRSIQLDLTQKSAVEKLTQPARSQFAELANVTTGLPKDFVR